LQLQRGLILGETDGEFRILVSYSKGSLTLYF
jgi:hypothetical protein